MLCDEKKNGIIADAMTEIRRFWEVKNSTFLYTAKYRLKLIISRRRYSDWGIHPEYD